MKKYKVPIFTEEYFVNVYIGNNNEIKKEAIKYGIKEEYLIENTRGMAFRMLPDKHPLIIVNGDLPTHIAIATLAHEGCHAINFISEYLHINDINGEFQAHGVSAILRATLKSILKK